MLPRVTLEQNGGASLNCTQTFWRRVSTLTNVHVGVNVVVAIFSRVHLKSTFQELKVRPIFLTNTWCDSLSSQLNFVWSAYKHVAAQPSQIIVYFLGSIFSLRCTSCSTFTRCVMSKVLKFGGVMVSAVRDKDHPHNTCFCRCTKAIMFNADKKPQNYRLLKFRQVALTQN